MVRRWLVDETAMNGEPKESFDGLSYRKKKTRIETILFYDNGKESIDNGCDRTRRVLLVRISLRERL